MQTRTCSTCIRGAFLSLSLMAVSAAFAQPSSPLDKDAVERAAGTTARITEDGVVRIGWSRDDVAVTIDGMPFRPQAGLGSWAAFKAMPNGQAMVMGDTVVFEDEITAAMDAAFEHGIEITALHNHFVFDRPPVFFMHIGGKGHEAKLATGVRAIWDAIKAVRKEHSEPASVFDDNVPEQDGRVRRCFAGADSRRSSGPVNNGVVKFGFARTASMHGVEFGSSMGLATWAAFSGSQEDSVVDGRLRHDGARGAARPAIASPKRYPHRCVAQSHDRREAGVLLPPLLGQGKCRRSRPGLANSDGRAGGTASA